MKLRCVGTGSCLYVEWALTLNGGVGHDSFILVVVVGRGG